jgi:hypothetical protein
MTRKQQRMERIRAVEREYLVATVAARGLDERFRADPFALVAERLEFADYRNFRDHLEATYLIRLFAEFEAGLREAWEVPFGRTTVPGVRDLIDSLHAQCSISQDWRDCVHDVCIYRNALVPVSQVWRRTASGPTVANRSVGSVVSGCITRESGDESPFIRSG